MDAVVLKVEPTAADAIADALAQALSEVAVETVKAQAFHWNVVGMAFGPLHALFQEIYEDHFAAQDELAERVRALDVTVDGRMSAYLARSAVVEADGRTLSDREMVAELARDQATISATLRALAEAADAAGDPVTNDLAVERSQAHDKFAWILRSHLR